MHHDLDMPALSLLHHYITHTSMSLFSQTHLHQLFQRIIPSYATEHAFLMHGLLAISSLHLAINDPSQRTLHTDVARGHQTKALQTYLPSLDHLTPSNCHAIFAFSCLTVLQTFAYQQFAPRGESLNAALQIMAFSRGLRAIYVISQTWMLGGDLCETLQMDDLEDVPISADVDHALRRLATYNNTVYAHTADDKAEVGKKAYAHAIDRLRHVFGSRGREGRFNLMLWPVVVQEQFVEMAKNGDSFALVLLAHYGVLLDLAFQGWWSESFGKRLVEDIRDKLGGVGHGNRWSELLEWPLKRVKKKPATLGAG